MTEALRLKADAYLVKPLNLDDLHQALTGAWTWPAEIGG
jgi:hypothetical protein